MRRASLAALVAVGVCATVANPLVFQADDSWFYLVIGRHVANGSGVSFNGVLPTNGFQPLWQVIVSLVVWLLDLVGVESAVSQARAVVVVGWSLLVLGTWRLMVLLGRLRVPDAGVVLAAVVPLVYLGGGLGTVGSEANLVFLLSVVALTHVLRLVDEPDDLRRALTTGAWLGLVVLGRLDTGFFALAGLVAVAVAGRSELGPRLRAATVAGACSCVVVGPYLAWNLVQFGHLLPIAGAIKLDRSGLWFVFDSIGRTGWILLLVACGSGLMGFVGRRPPRDQLVAWAVPLTGGLMSTAVYFAWSPGKLTDLAWYHVPLLLAASIGVALTAARIELRRPILARAGVALALVVAVSATSWLLVVDRLHGANRDFWNPVAEFSTEIGHRVPAGEVIATLDYPGVVAAYSDRPVLALDGLTGDFRFQDDLRELGAECALQDSGVRWLLVDDDDRLVPAGDGAAAGWAVEVNSWLHREHVGDLALRPSDRVLSDAATGLSLWRLHLDCERA